MLFRNEGGKIRLLVLFFFLLFEGYEVKIFFYKVFVRIRI